MSDRMTKMMLAVLLAFNILLVGAAIGGGAMWIYHTRPPATAPANGLLGAAEDLRPEQRTAFRQALQQARRSVADQVQLARKARDQLAGLLTMEPLDRSAIGARLEEIRNADMAVRTRVESAMVNFAGTLAPQDRVKFVEGLQTRGQILRSSQNK